MWVYIRGYKSKDYLKTQSTILFLFFAYQRRSWFDFVVVDFSFIMQILWMFEPIVHVYTLFIQYKPTF